MANGSGYSVPRYQFLTSTGAPNAGGSIYVYQTGTTTPITVYSDGALVTPIANPITLDSNGEAVFYNNGAVNMRIDNYTSSAGFVNTTDPVMPTGGSGILPGTNTVTNTMLAQANGYTWKGNATSALANVTDNATSQIPGTITNDSAAAGNIGEYITSTVLVSAAIAISSGVSKDVASIALTAGDWDVYGTVSFGPSAVALTSRSAWVSTTSATLPTEPNSGAIQRDFASQSAGNGGSIFTGVMRQSLSVSATVYLGAFTTFPSSTCTVFGFIGARRRR